MRKRAAALEQKLLGPGVLALADGTVFRGTCFGARRDLNNPVLGEVVFNTSMYGYQEILTDPSYAGQIITFTTPHIGNVGCNEEDWESLKLHAEGIIIRDLTPVVSNFRATRSLSRYLEENGVMGICGFDTRALVSHIRDRGAQMGAIAAGENIDTSALIDKARAQGSMEGKDYVKAVSCSEPYTWKEGVWSLKTGYREVSEEELVSRPHLIAVDCGIKFNILRILVECGFRVTVVPATWNSQQITALRPDALFFSNGPGDPAALPYVVATAQELLGKYPFFGICLGHQILGRALGAETFKLKFGHRGGNHPVKDLKSGQVEITVQNHGFAVDPKKLGREISQTHVNLNDNTLEGIAAPDLRAFSLQYHPEASPGPHDARPHFRRFFEMVVR